MKLTPIERGELSPADYIDSPSRPAPRKASTVTPVVQAAIREAGGLVRLAAKLGVCRHTLQNWQRGRYRPPQAQIERMARLAGVKAPTPTHTPQSATPSVEEAQRRRKAVLHLVELLGSRKVVAEEVGISHQQVARWARGAATVPNARMDLIEELIEEWS